jgi:hypothetical protein
MRHFIFVCPVFPGPIAARPLRMFDPAATARLIAPARSVQRSATRPRRTLGAVDMAPVAVATDQHLVPAIRVRAQVKPGLRHIGMAATAALIRRPPMLWTRAAAAAMMPLQSCLCTV